jgi:hypothetical protein
MKWNNLFDKDHQPLENEIEGFVATSLYNDLDNFLRQKYHVEPQSFYSACSMDKGYWKGWNVKYKKSGKSLAIEVRSESILNDVKNLIGLRGSLIFPLAANQ